MLENSKYALFTTLILASLPYTTWLSVSVVALITLRKGWNEGAILLIAGVAAHTVSLSVVTMFPVALANALLAFVPCYLAALILREMRSWRAVIGFLFLCTLIAAMLLHLWRPDLIMEQFSYFQTVLNEMQTDNMLMDTVKASSSEDQMIFANYLVGIQSMSIAFAACLSLMLARAVQSRIYYPGGFKQEMLNFRGDKLGLLILITVLIAAYKHNTLAINILPMLVLYFLGAGISLGYNLLNKKQPLSIFAVLGIPVLLAPFVMLPVYVFLGLLDSLFDFRLYLRSNAGKTI